MTNRRKRGSETWLRLSNWTEGQAAGERLSSHILRLEGFTSIDPSHPLGGKDGLKDVICVRDGLKWIGAAYFPRGQQTLKEIIKKFRHDIEGVKTHSADGIAFVTNQELKLSERKQLQKLAAKYRTELFHLERIASMLDSPQCYGLRLEFLDIEMSKEEQLAFIASRDAKIELLQENVGIITAFIRKIEQSRDGELFKVREEVPLDALKEFQRLLDQIAGYGSFSTIISSPFGSARVRDLQVPVKDLKEYKRILDSIVGDEFGGFIRRPKTYDLHVPLKQLIDYEAVLDRIIEKLKEKRRLEGLSLLI
ncbi:MAG TPA: hypothetical protein VGW12_04825 [Pyrinomonadaceae bacterium]|nr:hypothetical protein [Pyrinomonadaceae bacterium]